MANNFRPPSDGFFADPPKNAVREWKATIDVGDISWLTVRWPVNGMLFLK
jgi:hypothetical protein